MTSKIKSPIQVATFRENYTLQANTARSVTVTPEQLGLSEKNVRVLMTTVATGAPRLNGWYLDWQNYAPGVGVIVSMLSSTARTPTVVVQVLYYED